MSPNALRRGRPLKDDRRIILRHRFPHAAHFCVNRTRWPYRCDGRTRIAARRTRSQAVRCPLSAVRSKQQAASSQQSAVSSQQSAVSREETAFKGQTRKETIRDDTGLRPSDLMPIVKDEFAGTHQFKNRFPDEKNIDDCCVRDIRESRACAVQHIAVRTSSTWASDGVDKAKNPGIHCASARRNSTP
ncbi:hypothetical protein PUN4_510030 [Paraburkholderia unamae]|nr:hypothetical protein PUN4_510030 [Paraburkholderia unamae]